MRLVESEPDLGSRVLPEQRTVTNVTAKDNKTSMPRLVLD